MSESELKVLNGHNNFPLKSKIIQHLGESGYVPPPRTIYQRLIRRKAQLNFLCVNLHMGTRALLFFVQGVDILSRVPPKIHTLFSVNHFTQVFKILSSNCAVRIHCPSCFTQFSVRSLVRCGLVEYFVYYCAYLIIFLSE